MKGFKVKKLLIIFVFFFLLYVYMSRSDWYNKIPDMEYQDKIEKQIIKSGDLDISKVGEIVWEVPREKWGFQKEQFPPDGTALINYQFIKNNATDVSDSSSHKNLNFKFFAYSYLDDGTKVERLILNDFYFTNEFNKSRLCSKGSSYDLGYLGEMNVYPKDKIFIKLDILSTDENYSKMRLELQPTGPYRIAYLGMCRFVRDLLLGINLFLLILMGIIVFKKARSIKNETHRRFRT